MIVSMKDLHGVTGRRDFLGALTLGFLAMAELGQAADDQVIPFTDGRPFNPQAPNLPWDKLETVTPDDQIFFAKHYDYPDVDLPS